MENVQRKSAAHPLMIIAAIAVILFCAAGFAAIMGWIPKSGADSDVPAADAKAAAKAAAPTKQAARPDAATAARSQPKQVAAAPASTQKTVCRDCAVIESVREVQKAGEGSGLGAVAGGVIGGVVGNQVGSGRGQDLATVAGAVGGAVAGHQIEKHVKTSKSYQVTVRFEDGTTRVLSYSQPPSWRSGDRVRVVDGNLQAI